MKNKKSLMEYMRNRNAMQQPEPPKGTTLKANAARYSETRQQFRDKMADKYHNTDWSYGKDNFQRYPKYGISSFRTDIYNDDYERETGLKSKDAGAIGMSRKKEEIGVETTKYGKAVKAINKVGETSKAKAASKKKPMSMEVYSTGMANKANQTKGQTLKATPIKPKSGPSSVKAPAKAASKKKKNK